MIRSLILRAIYVQKHFNFMSHACILNVRVKLKNHHNRFLKMSNKNLNLR